MKTAGQSNPTPTGGEVLLYEAPDGPLRVDVWPEQKMVWLSLNQMTDLFDITNENVIMDLKNLLEIEELKESATAKDFLVVETERKRHIRHKLKHHSLNAFISVGYGVNSKHSYCSHVKAMHLLILSISRDQILLFSQLFPSNSR